MSLHGAVYAGGQSYGSPEQHRAGVTTRLTHRDYPAPSFPAPISSSASTSSSGYSLYDSQSPLCAAPAGHAALLDSTFRHPQAAWTPPPFRGTGSPSGSSQSPPEEVTRHYDYLGAGSADYVALSAMLSSAEPVQVHVIPGIHTHTHPFNGPFSGTTQVSRYQNGKTNLHFTEARDSEWQWHQLGHMQVCTSLQTDNHTSTHHSVFYRPDALPAAQSTVSKH